MTDDATGGTVLVSGGSGGIGGALCRQLATAGYRPVVAYSINRDAAEAIARESAGIAMALDLRDPAAIEAGITLLAEDPYPVVGCVLAASPAPAIAPVFRLPEGEMEKQWAVNVAGAHRLLDGVVKRLMRPRKQGWIVGILSAAMGVHGTAAKHMAGYTVAKYGLMGLLKAVAAEFPWLRVHTVKPGFTETPMLGVFDDRFLEKMRDEQPEGRFQTAEEVARHIVAKIAEASP